MTTPPPHTHTLYAPVGVVEAQFLNQHVDKEVPQGGGEGGEFIATGHGTTVDGKHAYVEHCPNPQAIQGTSLQSLLVLLPVHLRHQAGGRDRVEGGMEECKR